MTLSRLSFVWLVTAIVSCALPRAPEPRPPVSVSAAPAPVLPDASPPSAREARALLERRCVVCHGCYDAPCQLALGSHGGPARGASKVQVYDGSRLFAIPPTRLGIDARDPAAWREKGFHPVLPEGDARDPTESLLVRMLALKRAYPLPVSERLPDDLTLGIDRGQQCPRSDEFESFAHAHPTWGMPYALPGLDDAEHTLLTAWVAAGAAEPTPRDLTQAEERAITRWEQFLNGDSNKARLMARYVYEHLFLAWLHFDDGRDGHGPRRWFRLVRARNRSGTPDEIATRRPFDSPGDAAFFYRIVARDESVLAKTHMPYRLDDARLAHWKALFLDADYTVNALPSYAPETAANPFAAFAALPVRARYRFMLEEAQFTMMGFIKGPVCRGQVALDVIEDRFWISFVDPESPVVASEADLLARTIPDLRMPAEQGSNGLLFNWRRYARGQKRYLEAKGAYLESIAKVPGMVSLKQIWDGDGHNDNAALTVFRHFDSATVVKGFAGSEPKTSWVVGYALLERIHYLLVAGFDVFGNIGHQLHTRMYMDFLRMEAEYNYLLLLPSARRRPLVDAWYRDTSDGVKDHVYGKVARFKQETGIRYQTATPERELNELLKQHLARVRERKHDLAEENDRLLTEALAPLTRFRGPPATLFPETSFLEVVDEGGDGHHFTLLRDSAHTNVAYLFGENKRRRAGEDSLDVLRGFVGAYPNAFFRVDRKQLASFVESVRALTDIASYTALRARYGVRRTNPTFWQHSDRLHEAQQKREPREGGLLDFNRLDDG
ncbi:MAG: fatty acid cis/trans isomerase [Polyangiales bacterium]